MDKNLIFKGFKKTLISEYGAEEAERVWVEASHNLAELKTAYLRIDFVPEHILQAPASVLLEQLN